jgi:serine/threonine protein kinase
MLSCFFLPLWPKQQDLKPLNIMKVGEDWKLIDLDAAAKIGEEAGLKSSTGYVPPELIILSSTGEASVRDPTQAGALTADSSFDMWSLGALLYLLITGQTLFNNDQDDNLDDHDLIQLCNWNAGNLRAALRKVHNPSGGKHQMMGRDLLEKLLQPEASKRPKTMDEVLGHPFFVGDEEMTKKLQIQLEEARANGCDQTVILKELRDLKKGQAEVQAATERVEIEQKKQTQLLEAIKECTIKIEGISDQTYNQLRKTERVLLRSMFEATEVTLPTSFVILPSEIEAEGPSPAGPLIQLAEDGSGVELGAVGEEVKKKIKKGKGWFDKVCKLGTSIATG